MRLKSRQTGGSGMIRGAGSSMQHEDELLNGSNASSTSSASAVDPNDDLDLDSGDDDIDVGTNADSMGFGDRGNSESGTNLMMSGGMDGSSVMYGSSSNGHHQVISFGSLSEADRKRAHHNALERKRRDHIKDSFHTLRDAIPNIRGEKKHILKTSRAQILKAATEYIKQMRTRNTDFHSDIETLRRQNAEIENQIRQLERAKIACSGGILSENNHHSKLDSTSLFDHFDLSESKDTTSIKFEPTETSSTLTAAMPKFNVITSSGSSEVKQPATIQIATTAKGTSNGVLVLNKPIITATGPTAANASPTASAQTKKFKTIINTKNNINIINLNHAKLATTIPPSNNINSSGTSN